MTVATGKEAREPKTYILLVVGQTIGLLSQLTTQLRTDGVHCRESAGTGPVNLKVVPEGCCLGRSPWTN